MHERKCQSEQALSTSMPLFEKGTTRWCGHSNVTCHVVEYLQGGLHVARPRSRFREMAPFHPIPVALCDLAAADVSGLRAVQQQLYMSRMYTIETQYSRTYNHYISRS
jgi:hypothetical protein